MAQERRRYFIESRRFPMANMNKNIETKKKQNIILAGCVALVSVILIATVFLLSSGSKNKRTVNNQVDLTGVIDESFTDSNAESALTAQQTDVDNLKGEILKLQNTIKAMGEEKAKEVNKLEQKLSNVTKDITNIKNTKEAAKGKVKNPELWHKSGPGLSEGYRHVAYEPDKVLPAQMQTVSFADYYKSDVVKQRRYVPSNTSVRAVLLGGADADASVSGQSNNNGVMLFKFLDNGTMPNGKRAWLQGCRVSASSYGDISSERAYATLYKLSCAKKGEKIIDKQVTGWVFFGGKVGIKGQPLMRDGKIVASAGIAGGLSGIAQAAQAAQSIQNINPLGATSILPSNRVGEYAGLGGASKAAEQLSSYYIKRAEQYHPVIQVGAGNVATIVFKDGFYFESTEDENDAKEPRRYSKQDSYHPVSQVAKKDDLDVEQFSVPEELFNKIDRVNSYQQARKGVK